MGEIWKKMFLSEFDVRRDMVVYRTKFMDTPFFFRKSHRRVLSFPADAPLHLEARHKIKR